MGKVIFRAGTHRSIDGQTVVFSETELAAIATAYDARAHEAPVVVGHPQTDDPAMGWVAGLKAVGGELVADFRQLDPAFAEDVRAGRYKHVSAAFYAPQSPYNPKPGNYYLRHVGVLGAMPPAVKGLGALKFAEGDTVFVAFGEDDAATEMATPRPTVVTPQDAAPQPAADTISGNVKTSEDFMTKTSDLSAENADLKRRLGEMEERMKRQEEGRRHAESVGFAESLVAQGRLAPAGREVVVAVLDALARPQADGRMLAFGEGDGARPLAEQFREYLQAAEPRVMFGEFATNPKGAGAGQPKDSPLVADAKSRAERAQARG